MIQSEKILVSVCMITYKHERYIAQAIESAIMQQGDFEIEVIIGDDASPDQTRVICKAFAVKYPDKVKLLSSSQNLGAMKNFARTFSECKGKYVALLEGDDYWTDDKKIQKQIDFLEKNINYEFVAHRGLNYVMKENEFIKDNLSEKDVKFRDFAIDKCMIHTMSVVFRNGSALKSVFSLEWVYSLSGGDLLLYFLMTKNGGKGKILNDLMGVYRIHSTGTWQGISTISRIYCAENDLNLYLTNLSLSNSQSDYLKWQFREVIVGKLNYRLSKSNPLLRRFVVFLFNRILFCWGPGRISAFIGAGLNSSRFFKL